MTLIKPEAFKRRGPGRPPAYDGKTARIPLRVKPADKAAWQAAADAAGLSLNAWAERAMRKLANEGGSNDA